ncbi:sodium:glutamate symporter [Salipaludibacillus agaradhaerens]|uniref:Sodium:glutamate symporter n=1 Tax=Salipaludibacillus agaradhaerens TaxID=76935 RepID=A0A9Q4B5G8_SALAG|nr:sodium/glutamate symporter [Salipaludibacillus agaradhaerens]MCR6098679.1 sodium:glutamate symporter [Salipaludibacillus agaradhaerens]MCR6115686.1 sodium:glutamate symporter [Salipaludibacillus agaradhaerens]
MSAEQIGFAFILLGLFIVIGKWVRVYTPLLQQLYLPSSIIAGLIALLVGPEVLGRLMTALTSDDHLLSQGLINLATLDVWEALPGLFINIVFATLFLGKSLPSLSKVWHIGGPQVAMGQMVSWGQYVIGLLLVLLILTPFFGVNPLAGALIEISFVGGHGTAAGLGNTFAELGFAEGQDLAIGLATVGILTGVIVGIILINWGARKGHGQHVGGAQKLSSTGRNGIVELDNRDSGADMTTRPESIEPLSLHLAYVGIAIFVGWLLLEGLILLEAYTWGAWTDVYLMIYVPLFPLAMAGGIITQAFSDRFDKFRVIDRKMINRIGGFSLDILIISALATISLSVIGENIIAFVSLAVVGIIWNIFAFLVLAPKMIPSYWFERGIGDFGQATGITATGLLLMKVADPENKTPALEGFGYKQILFEPFVGGGLFTAASLPLIFQFGPTAILILSAIITLFWLLFGLFYFGKK